MRWRNSWFQSQQTHELRKMSTLSQVEQNKSNDRSTVHKGKSDIINGVSLRKSSAMNDSKSRGSVLQFQSCRSPKDVSRCRSEVGSASKTFWLFKVRICKEVRFGGVRRACPPGRSKYRHVQCHQSSGKLENPFL